LIFEVQRMTTIARLPATSALDTEFDAFLYEQVRTDAGAAPASVLSILARLDLDPWQEAAQLATMPEQLAMQRLIWLFAGLPGDLVYTPDAEVDVFRLIALLPNRTSARRSARAHPARDLRSILPRPVTFVAAVVAIAVALLVGSHFVLAGGAPPRAVLGGKPAATIASPAPVQLSER